MRRRILRTLAVGVYLSLAVLFGCSVSVGPSGRTVTFTIADKTFTFKLGVFEPFQVTADAEPVRQAAKIPLFDETPSDVPSGAAITVDPNSIEAIPLGVAKAEAEAQTISGTATMTVYIDDADSTNPCTNGTNIGTITLSITDSGVTLDRVELDVFGDALAHLLSGTFSICVEIAANINVSITIDQMGCIFGPPVEEPIDNTNENTSGTDNDNDNENVNDNVSGGGDVVQITTDPGNELDPQWDPASETIAFQTDRAPAGTSVRNIGSVQADGSGEGNIAVGPNSGFGVGGPMFWVGTTGLLIVNERVVFHEYMTFDTSQALFTRTVNDGDDEAFTRELFIPGGGGGDFITVSRDGGTVLWRYSTRGGAGTALLRTAPFSSLTGQDADAAGTRLFEDADEVVHTLKNGAALTPDGSQVVISLPSGDGFDLFLYGVSDPPILVRQLTSTGSSGGENNASPDISPDGTQVAFARTAPGEDTDLYVVGMDGTGLTQLTFTDRSESEPSWSPGGDRIAFQRADDDGWNIYVLTLGGGVPVDECSSDTDCASGETCVGGVCVPVTPDCTSDLDCGLDETCVGGVCVPVTPGCTSELDCGPDETCVDGTCVPGPADGEFTVAAILHRGSEQIIAGPNVDPAFGTVTPAGYGVGGYKQTALSGDNSKVWFALRDEFPEVGEPQNQLWSVNLDGSGGQRSIVPGEDSGYGLGVETNSDGSVCYADYRSAGKMFRATPGAGATEAFDYAAGGYGDIRGQFSISDDATKMVYTSYFDTRFMSVNLAASPNTPQEMANGTSLAYLGVNARNLYWDTDMTAGGSRWISASQHWSAGWDPTLKQTIWVGSSLGAGATPAIHASLTNLPKGNLNITDDGATVAYCLDPEGPGFNDPNECIVEAVDGSSSTTVGDGRTWVSALRLADDGSRAYYATDSCCSGGTGIFEDVATGQKLPSGTHAFLVAWDHTRL
ncbi:MAG: TolB family protein, partial [Planctomycetota bacterium]